VDQLRAFIVAIDEKLASRVRLALAGECVIEKKMMGGLCFMVRGNMCVGVTKNKLMVRVGADAHQRALTLKHAVPMAFTGKPLRGFVFVLHQGVATQRAVDAWTKRGLDFVAALPKKI
jgi:TfoX/Sxy family transcriptional regulator of competence genes